MDLPGIYSLSPYSAEEMVSRNFIIDERPDVIIDVVDATNMERNLYLTFQLAELGRPMVVALNMMDMLGSRGMEIDVQKLEHSLGLPVIPIAASRGRGIKELVERACSVGNERLRTRPVPFEEERLAQNCERIYNGNPYLCRRLHERRVNHAKDYQSTYAIDEIYSSPVMEAILRIEELIAPKCAKKKMALRWSAVKIIDEDMPTLDALQLTSADKHRIDDYRWAKSYRRTGYDDRRPEISNHLQNLFPVRYPFEKAG